MDKSFTMQDVIDEAKKQLMSDNVCLDRLGEAMELGTVEEAAGLLIDDTVYWK